MKDPLPRIFDEKLLILAAFAGGTKIRPIAVNGALLYQITEQIKDKAIHKNLTQTECLNLILGKLVPMHKKAIFFTSEGDYHLFANKRGEITIKSKPPTKKMLNISHNREKKYILKEGEPLPFLIELGLMNSQGKVLKEKMAKFRQINRFLEMVDDSLPDCSETIRVIDFGCGKAYLTFALYHYLTAVKGLVVHMKGLDLKEDVIAFCTKLARKLGYVDLNFSVGNIADYTPQESVDMVVALHACDTATDAALAQAVRWKAKTILAAPCCQHELFKQITSNPLAAILQYGILKERFASLTTDAARAQILEMHGYSTQILEFIEPEETPKNLLIRATLGNSQANRDRAKLLYSALKESLEINPMLESLLL